MTGQESITLDCMDGQTALQAVSSFRRVYAEVFAEPPYEETAEEAAASFRRFRSQARKEDFRAALARTGDGEPVGMAYGYPIGPNTDWRDPRTCAARTGTAPSA